MAQKMLQIHLYYIKKNIHVNIKENYIKFCKKFEKIMFT